MGSYSLSPEDIAPLLEGLAILGTGGGGSPELGKALLENDFAMGRRPTMVSLDEVNDEATVVSGGMMGSVKVPTRSEIPCSIFSFSVFIITSFLFWLVAPDRRMG